MEDWDSTACVVGDSRQFLPGCSARKSTRDKDKQILSNAMMQAYIAMRGPDMGDNDDPLFDWIKLHHDEITNNPSSQPQDNPRDVSKMLELMDKAIRSENMGGDSPRDAIFEFQKPKINHIVPPSTMNLSPHKKVTAAVDHHNHLWVDDGDDDEGAVPTGHLSPCTFLELSHDCKRWSHKEIMDPSNALAGAERMRPHGLAPVKDHYPYYLEDAKPQKDHKTGEEFSPLYHVPEDPSLIFTPPGVPNSSYAPTAFLAQYDRMAPLEAKKLRDHLYGKAEKSMPPASTNDKFTNVR
ncbi:hypothetical protein K445DRAFT_165006 [Daldinia sp. EC12]|nr:hypothetical protein K445DRAFT_165006 [Daldinia sp. EC12]